MIEEHSKEELNAVAVAAQSGDRQAMEALFVMMRPYMVAFLRQVDQYQYTLDERYELSQAAALGVLEALKRFDPKAGTKFSTWAYPWMKGEVSEWLARNTGGLPMPRSAWNYALRLERAWRDAHGSERSPHDANDDELANLDIDALVAGDATTISIPYAGAIFRARKDAFSIDPDLDAKYAPSAEDEALGDPAVGTVRLGVTARQEDAVLAFIEFLDHIPTDHWRDEAEAFVKGEGLDIDPDTLIEEAALYYGIAL